MALALETGVASQGRSADEALVNLREALELQPTFEAPVATVTPEIRRIEIEVAAS